MRILISGGTGLIGTALVQELLTSGHEIVVLTRNPEKMSFPTSVQVVGWDGRTPHGWGHLVDGAGAIVNLAGHSIAGESLLALFTQRWTPKQKRRILESRLNAGQAITKAVQEAKNKPNVLIQASAVGYYGSRGGELLKEEAAPGTDFTSGVCVEWEASTKLVQQSGVRQVVIRTAGVVLSTRGGALPFMMLPFKMFAGGPIGNGKQWFSWIHITDEVRAIRFLIENPGAEGVFNLSAPGLVTNAQFSHSLGLVMKRPAFVPLPAFFFQLALGEKATILLGSQRQSPSRLQQLGFIFQFPEIEPALRDLLQKP